MNVFNQLESNVRSYCRSFPVVFKNAKGSVLEDEQGYHYLDFFSGAGTLNYGHNNPVLKAKLVEYMDSDGIAHGLDMATVAKREFIRTFDRLILKPRNMQYKLQFPGPTGTNAVEAALKIVRRATGRRNVIAFTNGFHGVTLGSLAATANAHYRTAAGLPSMGTTFMPFDGYMGQGVDTTHYLDKVLSDRSSGVDRPAAVIVETVQGEGGVNVADFQWLRSLEKVCRSHGTLLVVDDIQVGCGRTGPFFSFEEAGISPDVITLSKSLSGLGLPFSLVLLKPDLDLWKPGEHNGTFRGNNFAFVTSRAALEFFWRNSMFSELIQNNGERMHARLEGIVENCREPGMSVRGRGMIQGLDLGSGPTARAVVEVAFQRGLIIESSGSEGQVIKCLPPLTSSWEELEKGLDILELSVSEVLARGSVAHATVTEVLP